MGRDSKKRTDAVFPGGIPGTTRFGHVWAISANVERLEDGRVTTGEYRNWRKKRKKTVRVT